MLSNFPPGVTEDMIPGNSKWDVYADKVFENLDEELGELSEKEELEVFEMAVDYMIEEYTPQYVAAVISKILQERRDEEKDFT